MNILFWIIQGLLALAFGMVSSMKLLQTKEQLGARMGWVEDFSQRVIRLIGAAEFLGALGLILPAATKILPWLTPTAAAGLVIMMAGASYTHLRRKEFKEISAPLVLLVLSAVVAIGRFWVSPI